MFGKAFSKIKSAVEGRLVKVEAAVLAAETEGGQGTTEYALLIGLFIVAVIVAMTLFRTQVATLWSNVTNTMNNILNYTSH